MISQTLLSPQAAPFWPGRKEHPGKRARFSTALLTATEAADAAGGAPASSQTDAETASRNEAGLGHATIAGQPNITQPPDARVDQLPGRRLGASWEPEEGCTGFQEPRAAARPRMVIESSPTPVLQNRFSVLATEVAEPERAAPEPPALNSATFSHPGVQAMIHRLVEQMRVAHSEPRPQIPVEQLEFLDDAESVKSALMQYTPRDGRLSHAALSKSAALWNRVAMHRLRFRGQRHYYMVVRTLDLQHRLLVLQVPPAGLSPLESEQHARTQMTYSDDLHGRYQRGLRLKDSFVEHTVPGEEHFKEGYLRGFPLNLIDMPAPVHIKNYSSYELDNRELAEADAERQHAAGFIEELNYYPHIIHPQGGILKDNGKFRSVLDCAASGLNKLLVPLPCQYDLLEDTLHDIRPGDYLSGFDFKDAFYLWPRLQQHCDYFGIITPGGRVFRYRFTPMGLMDSPAIQSIGARVFKRAIDARLAQVCARQAVAGATDSKVLGVFVDDGKIRHDEACTTSQMNEQYQAYVDTISDLTLPGAGEVDSEKKREWPAPTSVHTGVLIDPRHGHMHVSVTDERRHKYVAAISELTAALTGCDTVNRKQWASALGKLQHTAPLVRGMQSLLSTPYSVLKDTLSGSYSDWSRHARSRCQPRHLRALQRAGDLLRDPANCKRRIYHDGALGATTFWKGEVADTHEYMYRTSSTSTGIPVYTGDADKGAAGVWYKDRRYIHPFPEHHQPPYKSSNFRELTTALIGLQQFGHDWEGLRVLYRSDNSTTVAVINKQGSPVHDLNVVAAEIIATARRFNVDLAAKHIPGCLNGLADRLSRHRRLMDTDDWKLRTELFDELHLYLQQYWLEGRKLSLDGGADVVCNNAQVPRFCSEVDSLLDRDLRGEDLWLNPAFSKITQLLRHVRSAWQRSPHNTSATLLVPEWTTEPWWRLLRGARIIARYPKGTRAFTSPDWQALGGARGLGSHTYGPQRVDRGVTRWPFVVIHFPCTVSRRSPARAGQDRAPHSARTGRPDLRVLRGDPAADRLLLRSLRAGIVR